MNLLSRRPAHAPARDDPPDFSISFADLMTGLLMVFIFLLMAVLFWRGKQLAEKESDLQVARKRLEQVEREVKMLLGVRADLVALLQRQLAGLNEKVAVDPKTGAIRIGEAVLFDYRSAWLKPSGQKVVERVYGKLTQVLFRSGFPFRKHLASIQIEGHASREPLRDQSPYRAKRDYLTNLELSQQRAQAVLSHLSGTGVDQENLRRFCVAVGYGYSRLRNEAQPASPDNRRIEVSFRLRDEEALEYMRRLLEARR